MSKHIFFPLLAAAVLTATALSACHEASKRDITEAVDSFSTAYFNWQFDKAQRYCDANAKKWMAYAAAQVNEQDVDALRAMEEGASVKVKNIDFYSSDDTATVTLEVHNFLDLDSIGKPAHSINNALFNILTVKQGDNWRVTLNELPKRRKCLSDAPKIEINRW